MTSEDKKKKAGEKIINGYINNGVCMAEYLASEYVPANLTYEDAFEVYITMMKTIEGDQFYTIKEGETIEL